jgi:hypothetical protein
MANRPEEEDDDPIIPGSNPAAPNGQPTGGAPAGAPTEPKVDQGEGVHQVRHSDFKRIKQEQRDRGRREALDDLDAKARASGFTSYDDALKALAELKKPQPAAPPIQPQEPPKMAKPMNPIPPKTQAPDQESLRKEAARANDERVKTRKQWKQSEAKRRELQSQLDAKDAEMALREECYRAGVQDVDYTIRLLTRQLEGKTADEIAKFDRNAFYTGLRTEKPYLFGEKVAPATTGVDPTKSAPAAASGAAPGGAPATPAPGAANAAAADEKKFDARTAKPQEVQARLKELGLNPHM